jgi:hypothetical protein
MIAAEQRELAAAHGFFEVALTLARERADSEAVAANLMHVGNVAFLAENVARARAAYLEALMHARVHGRAAGVAQGNLALLALFDDDLEEATKYADAAVITGRHGDDAQQLGAALRTLARVRTARGDPDAAATPLAESFELIRSLGEPIGFADFLEISAGLVAARADFELTATLLGAADALRKQIEGPRHPPDRVWCDRLAAAARVALTPDVFATVHARGTQLRPDEAAERALAAL